METNTVGGMRKSFEERHPYMAMGILFGICVAAVAVPTAWTIKYSAKTFSKYLVEDLAKNGVLAIVKVGETV